MRIALTVTLALVGVALMAQDQGGRGRGRFRGPNAGFGAIDTNGDGILDANEIAAAPAALAKLDKNGDGQITSDELLPPMPQGAGRGDREGRREGAPRNNSAEDTVQTLMAFDANGDGKLSREELPERFRGIFDRGDQDKDGFLTPAEIRKAAAAQSDPSASDGPGERGGRFGGRDGFRGEMNFIRFDPVLAAVDSNADGVISPEEIRNSPAAIRKLDKNGDGQVTREEAAPAIGRGRGF